MTVTPQPHPVYVVGAGPGGLAVAAALRARGVRAVVLEKSDAVGASWRHHYDRLRLHTTRRLSSLPGLRIPRSFGRWVARADVVRYLEKYAEFHDLEIVTGVEVTRIEQEQEEWILHATGGRRLVGCAVVVATGFNHTPRLPDWPGLDAYTAKAELVHASAYRNPTPYEGRDVLVVGAGNTGAEIAADLAGGGAARVRLAVRTPPYIVRRSTLGWPTQRSGILIRRLPVGLVDRLTGLLGRFMTADLSAYGLPRPTGGLYSRVRAGAIPVQDVGLVAAVRAGKVEPVAAVDSFEGGEVVLADGSRITPDAVIAATGYRRALEPLLGHLGVLDERGRPVTGKAGKTGKGGKDGKAALPQGLYFTGFTNPISGMFREMALDAERIAGRIARRPAKRRA
ncbi:NAD(P)/FAD-dependent oxidoreductase [Streptomyces sp. SKN60]|uniref:flavin-containing monooxygenase n=1 Tax=Streptomyces sp. SKN60 TaxID=2855506 RepID=UPI0022460298|nr:NAD(P)/FAD-dependent oxidoreductase [Streptomyces sp. SKN60]MCX2180961.1 NAD(P)/FAD-dependent oxidoreductase [Streptomyces sp. SKN60]